jgi:hypothetical protein
VTEPDETCGINESNAPAMPDPLPPGLTLTDADGHYRLIRDLLSNPIAASYAGIREFPFQYPLPPPCPPPSK